MGEQQVDIRRTENGFIVSGPNPNDGIPCQWVFEGAEDVGDVDALQRALYQIIEILGMVGDRYDAQRIKVVVEPGDKWESNE